MNPGRPLLTIGNVAKQLSTSERHVRELIFQRRLPYLKVGKLVRFDPRDVDLWITKHKVPANLEEERP